MSNPPPQPRVPNTRPALIVAGLVAAFAVAYVIKSRLGIDLFPDMHVQDALARTLAP